MDFSLHLFHAQIKRKWIGQEECISHKFPLEPQGEEKDAYQLNSPLLTYYAVSEIALPACDRYARWHVISDCNIPELFDSWKTF